MIILAIPLESEPIVKMFKDMWKQLSDACICSHWHDLDQVPYIPLITRYHIGDLVNELPLKALNQAITRFKPFDITIGEHFTYKRLEMDSHTIVIAPTTQSKDLSDLQKAIYDIYPSGFRSEIPKDWTSKVEITDTIAFRDLQAAVEIIRPGLTPIRTTANNVVIIKNSLCCGEPYSYTIEKINFNLGS